MNLPKIPDNIMKPLAKAGAWAIRHEPDILLGAGIAGIIGGNVLNCNAAVEANRISSEWEERFKEATSERELKKMQAQCLVDILKKFAPGTALTAGGILATVCAHNVQKQRILAIAAAYETVNTALAEYRSRVRENEGEEKDLEYLHGVSYEETVETIVQKNGKEREKKVKEAVTSGNGLSMYARWWSNLSSTEYKDPMYNRAFLIESQAYFNQRLHTRGFVLLNEVYEHLGFDPVSEGCIVGWKEGNGDNYVSFGIDNDEYVETRLKFQEGGHKYYDEGLWLDFNVDGVIYDLI